MTNSIQTDIAPDASYANVSPITRSFTNKLKQEQAERRNSLTARCQNPHAKAEVCKRIVAENASNPDFQAFSSEELRKAIDKELRTYLAKTE